MMRRPPTPKNEKPAVTIANLDRENDNLAARIDELSKRYEGLCRDHTNLERDRDLWKELNDAKEHTISWGETQLYAARAEIEAAQAKIAKLESVLCGYRQAIADVHGQDVDMVAG